MMIVQNRLRFRPVFSRIAAAAALARGKGWAG